MGLFDLFNKMLGSEDTSAPKQRRTRSGPAEKGAEAARERRASVNARAKPQASQAGPSPPRQAGQPASARPAGVARAETPPHAQDPAAMDQGEMDAALDEMFDNAAPAGFETTTASGEAFDRAAVWELFAGVAANQSQPVKDFMFELHRGTANKDWLDICGPVMGTLIEAANAVEMTDAAECMGGFSAALQQAATEPGRTIDGAARELLLEQYAAMAEILPDSFALGEQTEQRESIIIHSLLKQVSGVGHVTFERLYGSGLTTLAGLFQATERDLVATTGIPESLCAQLCQRLRDHRRELEAIQRAGGSSAFRTRLVERTAELRKANEAYERVAESNSSDDAMVARKRAVLQERQQCAFRIEVLLAEMGEVELAEYLQKLPFGRRLETLEEFLAGETSESGAEASAGVA